MLVELQNRKKGACRSSIVCTSERSWERVFEIFDKKQEFVGVNLELMRSRLRLNDGFVRHLDNTMLCAVWDARCKTWESP